jgi:hypothetical protein
MVFGLVSDVFVVVHADMPPSVDDWADMIRFRDAHADRVKGHLVVAPAHATINARQREDVKQFWQRTRVRIALLTNSRLARGAAIAVAWFGVSVRAWAPECIDDAMAFLAVPVERQSELRLAAQALAVELQEGSGPAANPLMLMSQASST